MDFAAEVIWYKATPAVKKELIRYYNDVSFLLWDRKELLLLVVLKIFMYMHILSSLMILLIDNNKLVLVIRL